MSLLSKILYLQVPLNIRDDFNYFWKRPHKNRIAINITQPYLKLVTGIPTGRFLSQAWRHNTFLCGHYRHSSSVPAQISKLARFLRLWEIHTPLCVRAYAPQTVSCYGRSGIICKFYNYSTIQLWEGDQCRVFARIYCAKFASTKEML